MGTGRHLGIRTSAKAWALALCAMTAAVGTGSALQVEGRREVGGEGRPSEGRAVGDWSGDASVTVSAEEGLTASRIDDPPRIDGRLDDLSWQGAEVAHGFVQQSPTPGAAASEESRVRILVGERALYVGARLDDRSGDDITARLARRDEAVVSDWFYVYLDSYRDRRTAFAFGVSAAGAQRDLRVSDDRRQDAGWDAVWESAVSRDHGGWSVEMRIPLSQLRFNAGNEQSSWGLNFRRDIARKSEVSHWAAVPPGADRFVSVFSELRGLTGIEPRRRIEVLPHTVARLTRAPGNNEDPFFRRNATFSSVGANLRMGLGSSLTLSAAINPDFGQVEADPATVNLTAFETFQQERRPFFVEGSEIFNTSFPFWPPFFYSRRIGRAPQGFGSSEAVFQDRPSATTILGAVKLSGKTDGGWSIGLLDAVTGAERSRFVDDSGTFGRSVVEPRTNYSVARVAREFREGAGGVGTIFTAVNRQSVDELDFLHRSAYGFGADAFNRFGGGTYIANLSVLGSHVRGSPEAIARTQRASGHYFQRPDARHVTLDPQRTSLTGISVSGRVQKVAGGLKWGAFGEATSPSYEVNDFGFNPTLDHFSTRGWVRYEAYEPGRLFRSWFIGTMLGMERSWGGELKELTGDLGFFFTLNNSWGGGVWGMRHQPAWTITALRGGPALRRPGRWMGSLSLNTDRSRPLNGDGSVFWTVEDETGGYDLNTSINVSVRPSDQLELRVGPRLSFAHNAWQYVGRRDLSDGPLYLTGGIDRRTVSLSARASYAFSPRLSLQVYTRPFLASGTYDAIREVRDPRASAFRERFRSYAPEEAILSDGLYSIDRTGDGVGDLTIPDPSFNLASLQMNTVLRWEYRPGSTVFAVWTHDRDRFGGEPWDFGEGLDRLAATPARNVFQLKVSYWLGM